MTNYARIASVVRKEFDRRVEQTGLNTWPIRGGVSITRWGNEGRDIEGELNKAGLEFDKTLSGTFIVSSWPMQQAAMKKAAEMAEVGQIPADRRSPSPSLFS